MKKIWKAVVAGLMICNLFVSSVYATPTVDELEEDKAAAESRIEALERDLTYTMSKIGEVEEELVRVGGEIIAANEQLAETQELEKTQYEAMKKRIVLMYENGNTSMVSMILEAGSIAEMLQQAENVQAIHSYDRKQLEEYVKTKESIASLKSGLEEDMAALERKQAEFEASKESLNAKMAELESKVDDFEERIQEAREVAYPVQDTGYVPPVGTGGGSAIVAEAYKYLGVPYVWGGTSPSGMDCSGLVLLAHRAIGVSLAHYSGTQGSGGQAVSPSDRQPGDVVCYAGHVGIYVGGGQMIHAPQTGDVVRVVSVYGSPWYRRYW